MKKIAFFAIALLPSFALANVDGVWKTEANEQGSTAFVKIESCGELKCGTIVDTLPAGSDKIGMKIVWDMASTDGVNFTDGKIHDPSKNKTYDSKMSLEGDILKVSGCIAFLCREQSWVRVK